MPGRADGPINFLCRFLVNRAAKASARKLLPWLQRNFGASAHYTPAQIRRSAAELRLSGRFLVIGHAALLPETEFEELGAEMTASIGYQEARDAFERYRTSRPASASGNNEVGLYIFARAARIPITGDDFLASGNECLLPAVRSGGDSIGQ